MSEDRTTLYFPLINNLDNVVGYKKVQAGREDETESHGLHMSGLFCSKAMKGAKTEAVLVPTIQDVLNLASHKIPGEFIYHLVLQHHNFSKDGASVVFIGFTFLREI